MKMNANFSSPIGTCQSCRLIICARTFVDFISFQTIHVTDTNCFTVWASILLFIIQTISAFYRTFNALTLLKSYNKTEQLTYKWEYNTIKTYSRVDARSKFRIYIELTNGQIKSSTLQANVNCLRTDRNYLILKLKRRKKREQTTRFMHEKVIIQLYSRYWWWSSISFECLIRSFWCAISTENIILNHLPSKSLEQMLHKPLKWLGFLSNI